MLTQTFFLFTLRMATQLLLLIVGILALFLAGRAPAKRGLIRVAGALLILGWLGFAASEAVLWFAPGSGLTGSFSYVIVPSLCAALILLLVALAFGGRGTAQSSAAEPRPAGGPAWGPSVPEAGQYGQSGAPGAGYSGYPPPGGPPPGGFPPQR